MKKEERNELHLKYRPSTLEEMWGNAAIKKSLPDAMINSRTYIFTGPRGCGKTTLARIMANMVGTHEMDLIEIDAADNTGVDDARKIKESARCGPLKSKFKFYIIDEAHRLSGAAMDSLLKTLEEPPEYCFFALATTELAKLKETIRSRAKVYEVKPLSEDERKSFIQTICKKEGFRLSPKIRDHIIEVCEGVPREMLVAMDTARGVDDDDMAIELIQGGAAQKEIKELCQALLKNAPWKEIAVILKSLYAKEDPENMRYAILGYMNAVALNSGSPRAFDIGDEFLESFMYSKRMGFTIACRRLTK